jgi:hypothetical protein
MSFRYHGNYCGPGWSAGEWQTSVISDVEPLDEFDATCQQHDAAYARGDDLKEADQLFYQQNIGRGPKRTIAAIIVGAQSLLRPHDNTTTENMTKLRGSKKNEGAKTTKTKNTQLMQQPQAIVQTAPAARGYIMTSKRPVVTRQKDVVVVTGREFLATVECQGVATFGLGKDAVIHPSLFYGGTLGQMARTYERYKFIKATVHYVPKVATSTVGEVVLSHNTNPSSSDFKPESSYMLNQAISSGRGVMGPLWTPLQLELKPQHDLWMLTDPFATDDYPDNVPATVQAYTQCSSATQVGYLLLDYVVHFKDDYVTPRSAVIPDKVGVGQRVTLTNSVSNPTSGNTAQFNESTLTSYTNGTVFRFVVDLQASSVATGTTFANEYQFANQYPSVVSAGSDNYIYSNVTIVGGMVIWLKIEGTTLVAYENYDNAMSAFTGILTYRTTGSTAGTLGGDASIVHWGTTTASVPSL